MSTPLPARNIFDGTANPDTSAMKTAMGNLRDFLAGLLGTTGAVVDAMAILGQVFPAGTRMSFNQTLAPTGWTKDTTINDSIMRIVSGTVGNGGSTAFSTFNAQTSTAAYTLTTADIPSHSHSVTDSGHAHSLIGGGTCRQLVVSTGGGANYAPAAGASTADITSVAGAVTGVSINNNGGGGSHSHGITTSIKYNDFIIASKD